MINLNQGKNEELLDKCKVLSDYMTLINKIRDYKRKTATLKEAVERAVDDCIEEDVLADFLRMHRSQVMSNCLTEFNEEVFVQGVREEGVREEQFRLIQKKINKGMSVEKIAEHLELSVDEVERLMELAENYK